MTMPQAAKATNATTAERVYRRALNGADIDMHPPPLNWRLCRISLGSAQATSMCWVRLHNGTKSATGFSYD